MNAVIFNIQKFSLNDGPGIRTVVFLKGCSMHCPWCSNPESQLRRPQLMWDERVCTGCGRCLAACPAAGEMSVCGKRHIDVTATATASASLEKARRSCPARALTWTGRSRSAEEVRDICLQDKVFYEQSGGGVTFSGGEPLVWPEFCIELADMLRTRGVDTCIETTAHASRETFDAVADRMDHLLIDMKHADSGRHRDATGADLSLIWDNTKRALASGRDVLVRTPVIPGFNDAPADARAMARRLRAVGAGRVQLLPFHNFGESKYRSLGMPYWLSSQADLHEEDLAAYARVFRNEGVDAFF